MRLRCPHCGQSFTRPSEREQFAAKGGKARAAKLSPDERRTIARKAAAVRWQDHRPPSAE